MCGTEELETKTRFAFNSPFWRKELESILDKRKIQLLYQPIVNIQNGEIVGYEALSRGPEDSPLHSPSQLFDAAIENQMLFALEQLCREEALNNISNLKPEQQLFLNMNAQVVNDPHFQNGKTKDHIFRRGFKPEQVTFEITERTAISDFESFQRSLYHYRAQGYTIAVDDAGAGYSSLQAIAELKPEYIKLDMSIIRGIHRNLPKQAIVESMVKLATAVNSKIIAEGVETPEELTVVHKLGVHYVQGYFLARPAFPAPQIYPEAQRLINNLLIRDTIFKDSQALGIKIEEIAESIPTVEKELPVCKVGEILEQNKLSGIVIVEDDRPVGLVMKDHLYYKLGTRYGVSLYSNKPIAMVMDDNPLVVNSDLPLEEASQIAMCRSEENLYDLIIVANNSRYVGVVSVMNLLNNVTKIQISYAHNSNPLTGLQGNLAIEAKLKRMLDNNQSFAVTYIDLDNFKAFNDKYGFERGDKAILLTSRVLSDCLIKMGCSDDFLGHIGGDDFILITKIECAKIMCEYIIEVFDRKIRSLYELEELNRGYVEVTNRRGLIEQFPIMSISLAVVISIPDKFKNYLEIGEKAAELKKIAKQSIGSSVIFDRRND